MGGEGSVEPTSDIDIGLWLASGLVIAVLSGAAMFWYASGSDLRACEVEIKSTLKAPSTYRRISSAGLTETVFVEYDSENEFGVPLRRKVACEVSHGTVKQLY